MPDDVYREIMVSLFLYIQAFQLTSSHHSSNLIKLGIMFAKTSTTSSRIAPTD